ncbi:MAG: YifB family Mg chelatase-like AAA ATPase [Granulosicoccus sp.]
MSFATVHSCALGGVQALPVAVEVHIAGGLPGMSIVGLPESAVRESKDRVKAAIQHIGLSFPRVKIIVNLAPADLPKRGGRFDLPIALGILQASGQLPEGCLDNLMIVGELGLTGRLRSIHGVLPTSFAFADSAMALFVPKDNASEALRSKKTRVHCADTLLDAVNQLRVRATQSLACATLALLQSPRSADGCSNTVTKDTSKESEVANSTLRVHGDMADVFGQQQARRALEIAAAGGHNLLMIGPPGTGKSMLASRLPTIQPTMQEHEAVETASILSISYAGFEHSQWGVRPFRAPHHTASGVALVGGGAQPMPGEISLAHNGVLFLDELPEFSRAVLDVLREPMETGHITVSRAARQAQFPSRFQLVAAMNPCPCGYHTDPEIACTCGADQILRYQSRVSGPFLDRIDLHLSLQREASSAILMSTIGDNETSEEIRHRVAQARDIQVQRQGNTNAVLDAKSLRQHVALEFEVQSLFHEAARKLSLSLRAQHRILRVARTVADLGGREFVIEQDVLEAITYRATRAVNSV